MAGRRVLPLRISRKDDGTYSVLLDGIELASFLAADGLSIAFELPKEGTSSESVVTMKFVPGGLHLDLDAELVAYLEKVS